MAFDSGAFFILTVTKLSHRTSVRPTPRHTKSHQIKTGGGDMPIKTAEHNKKLSEAVANLWKNPEYRAKMIKKQKEIGYRSYN